MTLPLLISVPHAGLEIPDRIRQYCALSTADVIKDGDEGAGVIYDVADLVAQYVITPVARAIVDMNRPETDFSKDGVIKTHTCWNVPVYRERLPVSEQRYLIETYHRPYHQRLRPSMPGLLLGVDCHTMAATAPPVAPDPGSPRPAICISNGDGATCPAAWLDALSEALEASFGKPVSQNTPFKGGHITRHHAGEMPWVQLELSRAPFAELADKRDMVLRGLHCWCEWARRHVD